MSNTITDKKKLKAEYDKKYRQKNRDKIANQKSTYCQNNKESMDASSRASRIKDYHGITAEEYESDMATSSFCELCGSEEDLCRDHDHITMKFRGVLCKKCNRGLGILGDTRDSIQKVLNYLDNVKEDNVHD